MNIGNEKYRKYLQSDKWRAIAKKRMQIDGYRCVMCGSAGTTGNPLSVHHLSYKWLYQEENRIYQDLETLCFCCHKQIHRAMERITSPDGRRGWKDARIPQIHTYNINGSIEYITGGTNNVKN